MTNVAKFQQKILQWYAQHGRDLPWRNTQDPYKILVSEFMLQQTQVSRVIEKYHEFLRRFPTIQTLARASHAEVIRAWLGLGYNRRAIFLHECARAIASDFNGIIPKDHEKLLKLPGIGPYMCRSILVFAFNADVAAVDTNIRRIFIAEGFVHEKSSASDLQKIAEELLPRGHSRDWHNALMDYGSLVLTSAGTGIKPLTRQSKFYKSFRWYRSKVVKLAAKNGAVSIEQISRALKKDKKFIKKVLNSLKKDKLIRENQAKITLPG